MYTSELYRKHDDLICLSIVAQSILYFNLLLLAYWIVKLGKLKKNSFIIDIAHMNTVPKPRWKVVQAKLREFF